MNDHKKPQVVERSLQEVSSLSGDIAKTLKDRLTYGSVIIVSRQPLNLLSSVMKQWKAELRRMQTERAKSLNAQTILECTKQIAFAQQVEMAVLETLEDQNIDVGFTTIDVVTRVAPICHTILVATPIDQEALHKMMAFMPEDGKAKVYVYKA